jgi:hypothetical protein
MGLQRSIGRPNNRIGIPIRLEHKDSMHRLRVINMTSNDSRFAHTWDCFEDAFDVLGKHLQTLGRGDDLFLPAPDHEVTGIVERAEVSRMKPPVFQRRTRLVRRVQVPAGDRWPSHADLAICGNSNVNPFERSSDRAMLRLEGVVPRHNRRRLG